MKDAKVDYVFSLVCILYGVMGLFVDYRICAKDYPTYLFFIVSIPYILIGLLLLVIASLLYPTRKKRWL